MPVSRKYLDLILVGTAGFIGFFCLSSIPRMATPILALPILWGLANNREVAFCVMFAYFFTASRGLLPGAAVFLSKDHTFIQAAAVYFFMPLGISLPFLIFWSKCVKKKALCLATAFIVTFALPPLSLIGVVNPLIASGIVFRGLGYMGMFLTLLIWLLCLFKRRIALLTLCVIFGFTVLPSADWYEEATPGGIKAVDTSFGSLGSGSYSFERDRDRTQFIFHGLRKQNLLDTDSKIIVLPETIAGRLNPTALDLWKQEFGRLLPGDSAVIFGGELPTDNGKKYDNAAIMLYKDELTIVTQRVPVPYSMYKGPFAKTGANLHLFDDGILQLPDGRKAAVVVCYEAYLTWPYLTSMRHKPDILISIANLWWCKGTSLPITQRTTVKLWGLLFGVPTLFATNL